MKANKGIALIASLLIMVAIMAMGIGSMFLTNMNLRIAENTRSSVVAKYNAEAGVDTATVLLKQQFEANGKRFPATWTPTFPATAPYRLLPDPNNTADNGYVRHPGGRSARVRVEGFTANDAALYVSEILLTMINPVNEAFTDFGLTSESAIAIKGVGGAEFLNTAIHGNDGVKLTGSSDGAFKTCTWGDLPGGTTGCVDTAIDQTPKPVSSSSGTCTTGAGSTCPNNTKPVDIAPRYLDKRSDNIAEALGLERFMDSSGNFVRDTNGTLIYADPAAPDTQILIDPERNPSIYDRCTARYTGATNLTTAPAAGSVICVQNGGLNLPSNIDMTGVTIIADGNITFGGPTVVGGVAKKYTDVSLISRSGSVMLDHVTGHNFSVFSGANRNIGSTSTKPEQAPHFLVGAGYNLTGTTTIASSENIQFDGNTQITTIENDVKTVTVAVISAKTITNSGRTDFYGVFWAGTGFIQNGSSQIYGSVAVQTGEINTVGKLKVNSSYEVYNPDILGAPVVIASSRR